MKKLLSLSLIVTSAIASSALLAEVPVTMPYEEQIAFIGTGFANTLSGLGDTTLDQGPHYLEALNVLADVQNIIKNQAKSTTIVPAATKAKLMSAINRISTTLINLKEARTPEERIKIAEAAIKSLQANLKTLKTGVLDIYKTPTDLKNALHKAVENFVITLNKWVNDNTFKDMVVYVEQKEKAKKDAAAKQALEELSKAPIFN